MLPGCVFASSLIQLNGHVVPQLSLPVVRINKNKLWCMLCYLVLVDLGEGRNNDQTRSIPAVTIVTGIPFRVG